jgi:hypothetical protein
MPSLDIYDSFGAGLNVTETGPFIPVDPSLQIGALTYSGSVATGSVTGNPGFNLVRITYTAIAGSHRPSGVQGGIWHPASRQTL